MGRFALNCPRNARLDQRHGLAATPRLAAFCGPTTAILHRHGRANLRPNASTVIVRTIAPPSAGRPPEAPSSSSGPLAPAGDDIQSRGFPAAADGELHHDHRGDVADLDRHAQAVSRNTAHARVAPLLDRRTRLRSPDQRKSVNHFAGHQGLEIVDDRPGHDR